MRVFAYFPEAVQTGEPTNVLFVMHGVNRNAEETFRRIATPRRHSAPLDAHALLPEKYNFVLLVPEFSKELFPGRNAYNFGNVFQVRPLQAMLPRHRTRSLRAAALAHAQACLRAHAWAFVPLQGEDPSRPNPREVWSFSVIERMFGAIKSVGKLNAAGYVLFGHSAGAQFVHRLLAFASRASANGTEQGHLLRAVAANAGSYTLPTFEERFPFGFGGLEALFSQEDLSAFVSAPLTVLLGQEDTGTSCRLHAFPSGRADATFLTPPRLVFTRSQPQAPANRRSCAAARDTQVGARALFLQRCPRPCANPRNILRLESANGPRGGPRWNPDAA
jgi:hypothetical protein